MNNPFPFRIELCSHSTTALNLHLIRSPRSCTRSFKEIIAHTCPAHTLVTSKPPLVVCTYWEPIQVPTFAVSLHFTHCICWHCTGVFSIYRVGFSVYGEKGLFIFHRHYEIERHRHLHSSWAMFLWLPTIMACLLAICRAFLLLILTTMGWF